MFVRAHHSGQILSETNEQTLFVSRCVLHESILESAWEARWGVSSCSEVAVSGNGRPTRPPPLLPASIAAGLERVCFHQLCPLEHRGRLRLPCGCFERECGQLRHSQKVPLQLHHVSDHLVLHVAGCKSSSSISSGGLLHVRPERAVHGSPEGPQHASRRGRCHRQDQIRWRRCDGQAARSVRLFPVWTRSEPCSWRRPR